ncbi:MAG: hypothetical protein KDH18_02605 [Rhodoferax sp.]|nr:hypothetical protein [Rhodoferax sp.]
MSTECFPPEFKEENVGQIVARRYTVGGPFGAAILGDLRPCKWHST